MHFAVAAFFSFLTASYLDRNKLNEAAVRWSALRGTFSSGGVEPQRLAAGACKLPP
ncbi:hypothetical protein BFJ69_g16545 [Fusarium oxysporum]|uniref:Uncharacterized protein n=1 Tax=Fusarium oxysporum TaxID=5507 RepID=A0A420MAU8_FUSOX|nr:hypothetical protein BFJ69_g16545 [Fusarium oxysporum]